MRRFEEFLSIIVALSAVVVAGTLVFRQFQPQPAGALQAPTYIEEWARYSQGGLRVGPTDAPLQVVVFGDFQCPFCAMFHETMVEVIAEFPREVSLVFRHFPLQNHPFAVEAGEAAECAAAQGRFPEIARELYSMQDSIGVRKWGSFADAAGVGDIDLFLQCMEQGSSRASVDADRVLGSGLDLIGVPAVIINGWKYFAPPTDMSHIAQEVLAGRSPFPNR